MDHSEENDVTLALAEVNIQDVIRERKAERKLRAEEKRQSDLRRIKDMWSTNGIDPLQQFPKEIWAKIFDDLAPEHKGNIWVVHPLFRDLLEKNRVRDILLPQVLNLIKSKFRCSIWMSVQPIFSFSRSRSNYSNQKFRLISKTGMKYFDESVEDGILKAIRDQHAGGSAGDGKDNVITLQFEELQDHKRLEGLLANFQCPGTRFFQRGLSVSISDHNMDEVDDDIDIEALKTQFERDILNLLERIGYQIWHFRFFADDLVKVNYSFSEMYILFQTWISLMPNLKWLEVSIAHPPQTEKETILEAESVLQNYPFPHLSHLQRLSFHCNYIPSNTGRYLNIYEVLLEANQHITMLDLDYEDGDHEDFPHANLPQHLTQHLALTRFTISDVNWSDRSSAAATTLASLRPMINTNWKLQTILLVLSSSATDNGRDSMGSLFRLLQQFPTLEKITLDGMNNFSVVAAAYLELPNLMELEIELTDPEIDYETNIHFFFSLQFLLHSKKLKKLVWQMSGFNDWELRKHLKQMEDQHFGKMLDFRGGLKYLYESNLWRVFPELEKIHTKFRRESKCPKRWCVHEYLRTDIESMTVRKFWNNHGCNRSNLVGVCLM